MSDTPIEPAVPVVVPAAPAPAAKVVVTGIKPSTGETKAQLAARLADESKAKTELAERVAAMEERENKRAADAKKAEREAAFAKHFDAAKVKPKFRELVMGKLADLDPNAADASAKIDAFLKDYDEVREIVPLGTPKTRWTPAAPGPSPTNVNTAPRGADFAPPREPRKR